MSHGGSPLAHLIEKVLSFASLVGVICIPPVVVASTLWIVNGGGAAFFPLLLEYKPELSLSLGGGLDVNLSHAIANLMGVPASLHAIEWLVAISAAAMPILFVLGLRVTTSIVRDFNCGYPFSFNNIKRLRWLAFFFFCGEAVDYSVQRVIIFVFQHSISNEQVKVVSSFDFDFMTTLTIVLLLIFAEIFGAGQRLEQEQRLTV